MAGVSTRVLLVDDDALVRAGLRMILSADPGLEVVGEAANGTEALDRVVDLGPDVVLMDLQMPVVDGVTATARLRALPGPPAVLVLTTFHLDHHVLGALRAGAAGYLLKDTPPDEIARAVRTVAAGGSLLSPAVTGTVLAQLSREAPADQRRLVAQTALGALSEREREVVDQVATGKANGDIARSLFMSEATVKAHVSHALTKTGTTNRVQLAILVLDAGR